MEPAIHVSAVCKNYYLSKESDSIIQWARRIVRPEYEEYKCLTDIDFSLAAGGALGFIGPNGAGKSSLIKILCGIQRPTSGAVSVLGFDPSKRNKNFLKKIGVVFGHKTSLWWDLPVKTGLETYRKIYQVSESDYECRMAELVEALNLSRVLNKPVRNLSLGERVKCELALSLIHAPELVFLDEPTVGLDVTSKFEIRKYLNYKRETDNLAIFLTSHDLGDIESCCDHAIILDRGCIRFDGTLKALNHKLSDKLQLTVTLKMKGESTSSLGDFKERMNTVNAQLPASETATQLVYFISRDRVSYVQSLFEVGRYELDLKASGFEDGVVNLFNSWASE